MSEKLFYKYMIYQRKVDSKGVMSEKRFKKKQYDFSNGITNDRSFHVMSKKRFKQKYF